MYYNKVSQSEQSGPFRCHDSYSEGYKQKRGKRGHEQYRSHRGGMRSYFFETYARYLRFAVEEQKKRVLGVFE